LRNFTFCVSALVKLFPDSLQTTHLLTNFELQNTYLFNPVLNLLKLYLTLKQHID